MTRTIQRHAAALAFFLIGFIALSWPAARFFTTRLLTDGGDGLQNVWNLWWVHKAAYDPQLSLWFTPYLHYPDGVSLAGHTLNPFNGWMALPFMAFLSLETSFNVILTLSFVLSGFTLYLLALELTGSCAGSVIAGSLFTFSNFHFAQAQGHLQLVAMEGLPLVMWCGYRMMRNPSLAWSAAVAGAAVVTFFCDYYYFAYGVIALVIIAAGYRREHPTFGVERVRALLISAGLTAFAIAPCLIHLLRIQNGAGFYGEHQPTEFSLDLLGLVIPGGHWRFAEWTRFYWSRLPGNIHEKSVHAGWAALVLAAVGWRAWMKTEHPFRRTAGALLTVFGVFALGPRLQIAGHIFHAPPLPYAAAEAVFPFLKLSGCPVRMVVMILLVLSLLAGAGAAELLRGGRRDWLILLLGITLFEYWPRPLPLTSRDVPGYVQYLQSARPGPVIDFVTTPGQALYFQTRHQHPQAFGYIARLPKPNAHRMDDLLGVVRRGDWTALRAEWGFRYLAVPAHAFASPDKRLTPVYDDAEVSLYAL